MSEQTPNLATAFVEADPASSTSGGPGKPWRQALTRDEIQELVRGNAWRSWLSIALNWGLVFAAMGLVAWAPNPLTVLLALGIIGARHLGMAVMMHEAAHQTLFRNRRVNDWVGNWICAFPIWADLKPYRRYHLKHHAHNWTDEDPDLDLATKYPVSRESLKRKIWRDLSGQVAWKRVRAILRRDLGNITGQSGADHVSFGKTAGTRPQGWKNLHGVVITNAVLLGILTLAGHPALYLLWVVAWFTTYSLVTRLRAIAEHNMVLDRDDEMKNTRTTLISWWERLFIAPNRVNFHLEHHLLMSVPFYNLPRMHRMLRDRGVLDDALVSHGYLGLYKQAASAPATASH
jgi:fatty acid desaturase